MSKKIINTDKAPAPIGPYSQAVEANGMLFLSGQIPVDASTGKIVNENIKAETKQVMENVRHVLTEAGLEFDQVIKTSIFIKDMKQFAEINEVYESYFTSDFPARETVEVAGLPLGVNVEISMIVSIK